MKKLTFALVLALLSGISATVFATKDLVIDTVKKNSINLNSYTTYVVSGPKIDIKSTQTPPTFPGGDNAFNKFVVDKYLEANPSKNTGAKVSVFTEFIVEKDGSLTDIKVLTDAGSGLGDDAIRILKTSPNWMPGTQSKKSGPEVTRMLFVKRVDFFINDDEKLTSPIKLDENTDFMIYGGGLDVNPMFKGGEIAFGKFLHDYIRYPGDARMKNITGRVFIGFIVEKDGHLSHFEIYRDPGYGLGEEALRVLKLSPDWIPGKVNGYNVRVQYTVPINFSLGR